MINSLSLRSNYKTLKKFTYLNQASLGLISEKTASSMIEFLNEIDDNNKCENVNLVLNCVGKNKSYKYKRAKNYIF